MDFYVKANFIPRGKRSVLAKFRTGVAPLRVETGRYESLPVEQRVCFNCTKQTEDEKHVLIECPEYDSIRKELYDKALNCEMHFRDFNDTEKLCFLLNSSIYSQSLP